MNLRTISSVVAGLSLTLAWASVPGEGQTPELKATASDESSRAFVADENNLRKLGELVRRRMAEQGNDFKAR